MGLTMEILVSFLVLLQGSSSHRSILIQHLFKYERQQYDCSTFIAINIHALFDARAANICATVQVQVVVCFYANHQCFKGVAQSSRREKFLGVRVTQLCGHMTSAFLVRRPGRRQGGCSGRLTRERTWGKESTQHPRGKEITPSTVPYLRAGRKSRGNHAGNTGIKRD